MGADTHPKHLREQALYKFDIAIDSVFKILGDRKLEREVYFRENYAETFSDYFDNLRPCVEEMIDKKENHIFDAHKFAVIALLTALNSRPLCVTRNGEAHILNEMVAFFTAVYIIRDYQVAKACREVGKDDDSTRKKVMALIRTLEVPDLIYGEQEPRLAIIISLRFLSRTVRKLSVESNADLVPVLSVLMFYIDNYSYAAIKEIASKI